MRRRDVIQLLAGAMVAAPCVAAAQTPAKTYRLGTLTVGPPIAPNAGTGAMLIEGPVSYTHLDVYKRQDHNSVTI